MTSLALVGLGPNNLSLAALSTEYPAEGGPVQLVGFSDNHPLDWHSGQNFPSTSMQSEFYRDLVTPVSPTNKYSFLNFLKERRRLNRFICAGYLLIDRDEFEEYLRWVSCQLFPNPNSSCILVNFNEKSSSFELRSHDHTWTTSHVSIAVGRTPHFPPGIVPSDRIIHVSSALKAKCVDADRTIVIGSGQSACECLLWLLSSDLDIRELTWVTGQSGPKGLDTNNFLREMYGSASFDPSLYYNISDAYRRSKASFDGAAPWTVEALYQALYRANRRSNLNIRIIPYSTCDRASPRKDSVDLDVNCLDGSVAHINGTVCIICTGYEWSASRALGILHEAIRQRVEDAARLGDYIVRFSERNYLMLGGLTDPEHEGAGSGFISSPVRNVRFLDAITGEKRFETLVGDSFLG